MTETNITNLESIPSDGFLFLTQNQINCPKEKGRHVVSATTWVDGHRTLRVHQLIYT